MRILVTGSTGFIGRKLCLELIRQGHSLVCLVRNANESKSSFPFPAEVKDWKNPGELKDIDGVVHLAGEPIAGKRWSKDQKEKILKSRTETAAHVLRLVREASGRRPSVFVSASAIGFYGDRGEEWLTEESAPGRDFLSEVCVEWEKAAEKARAFIPRVVCVRTGIVLGRDGGALAKMLPLFKAGLGGKLGSGKQWMSWIHIDDLVQIYCEAIRNEKINGPVNGTAPNPVTNQEFTKVMASLLKKPAWFSAPEFALKVALGEMSEVLLDSQRVKSKAGELGIAFRFSKLGDALAAVFKHVERARGALCHEFSSQHWVACPADQLFASFADPHLLEEITPPEFGLRVVDKNAIRLKENAKFTYELQFLSRPVECRAHIIDWIENTRISSNHQKGPFTLWFHVRSFERLQGGTLLTERILYRCRGGWFGSVFGHFYVDSRLAKIFRFRNHRLGQINKMPNSARAS